MNKRIIGFILLAVTLAVMTVSCANLSEEKAIELRSKAEAVVECLKTSNYNKAYSYMDEEYIPESEFKRVFPDMLKYLGAFTEYKVTGPTGVRTGISNGISYAQATYLVDTDGKDFYLVVGTVEERTKLSTFRVTLKEDADVASGRISGNIIGDSPLQIVVIAIGLASFGFSVWMLVDCIRKNIKKKPLWIVIIIFGQLTLGFTASGGGVNFNFNLGFILSLSTLAISESLTVLKLILPLGAVIYRIRRGRLIINNDPEKEYSQLTPPVDDEKGETFADVGNEAEKSESEGDTEGGAGEILENEGEDEKR